MALIQLGELQSPVLAGGRLDIMRQDKGIPMPLGPKVNEGKRGALLLQHHLPRELPLKTHVSVLDRPSEVDPRVSPRPMEPAQASGGPPGEEGLDGVVEAQALSQPPVLRSELTFAQGEIQE